MEQAKEVLSDIVYCDDPYSCADGADALVIVTEWEQFRALSLADIKQVMASPVLIDLRNVYRPSDAGRHGFVYDSVGRSQMSDPADQRVHVRVTGEGRNEQECV
jgi:UDPglucose 6-dehydrogenase